MKKCSSFIPLFLTIAIWLAFISGKAPIETEHVLPTGFDYQAHRGGRGLMPENTIPAMLHAIDLGVTTLEMDLQISKDGVVVVSHDPNFNAKFTTTPDGKYLTAKEAKSRLLYHMTYDSIRKYDVGLKFYSAFPRQKKMAASKPKLSELLKATEKYAAQKHKTIFYNIEIKSNEKGENIKCPPVKKFVALAMPVIIKSGIRERATIQSFDMRALQIVHQEYPDMATSLLVEGYDKHPLKEQFKKLGFISDIYSPEFHSVTKDVVSFCHSKKIKVIPWTVDDLKEMKHLKALGVDGLITDYPDLYSQLK